MPATAITGQTGFVGSHLYHTLGLYPGQYRRIPFQDDYFQDESRLRAYVKQCDVIVHLAAMNRHPDPEVLYQTNLRLVRQLIDAMEKEQVTPHVLFSSSTQEERDNQYGRSKREGRVLFESWALRSGGSFTGLVVPNVYGPFSRPNYNTFIATFAHKLTHGQTPQILEDSPVRLIYVGNLCRHILEKIATIRHSPVPVIERDPVPYDFEENVSQILSRFQSYTRQYYDHGIIPPLTSPDEVNLFNTYRSYIDPGHYPVPLTPHCDARGTFVETIKLGVGGQVSFSTTVPGVTRGNHYHTRKIERFTVIKGRALIQLRKIGSQEIQNHYLDGSRPSYVDMPVWYTHNITNIGNEELYTQFWINEWYDAADPDTYYEAVEPEK